MKIKLTLNDQNIKGLKPAKPGTRYDAWDIVVPGFSVRVTDQASKTFSVSGRLFNEPTARRFTIGKVGTIALAAARETARDYLKLLSEKKDPRTVEHAKDTALKQEVAADDRGQFRNALAKFLAFKQDQIRPAYHKQMTAYLQDHCLPLWGDRQIKTITTQEIGLLIENVFDNNGKGAARVMLSAIKTMFRWAAGKGLTIGSAAELISPKQAIGEKVVREHPLANDELKKIWNAQRLLGSPLGQIMRILILTGARLNEVAQGDWSEIDLKARTWTIAAARMKMKKPHVIHLTDIMIEVLRSLKRGTEGDYLFSLTDGKTPYHVGTRAKEYVVDTAGFNGWVNHDLRHTMRTRVAELGVLPHVAEKMIAHTKKGYDHHDYRADMRAGFELWHTEVARIVGWAPMIRRVA